MMHLFWSGYFHRNTRQDRSVPVNQVTIRASKCQKVVFIVVKVSLEGVVESEFQGRDVAQVRMMSFAELAKKSCFDLVHRGSLFVNINLARSDPRCLKMGPSSKKICTNAPLLTRAIARD